MGEPNYLGYKWKLVRQLPSSSGSTSLYGCVVRGCQILLQLKTNTISDISTIFISSGEHIHDQQNRPTGNLFGIDNKINKTIIIEYERINLKPSVMLRRLRDDIPLTLTIPSERQLNNFLKVYRTKKELGGNLGNWICLNDFLEIYESNKQIPINPDQMYVAGCITSVTNENNELERNFRIFFTTKRLLEFTKYVRINHHLFFTK